MIGMFFLSLVFSIAFCNSNYFSYEKIDSTLHAWSNEFGLNAHPSNDYQNFGIIYNLDTLGYSSRDSLPIFGVKLSANANTEEAEPKVLIVGQSHAEEIYGVEIAMEIINQFLHPQDYPQNRPKLQRGLYYTELWIIPTINPEGLRVVYGYEDESGNAIKDATYRKNKTDVFHHGSTFNGLEDVFDYLPGVGQDIDGVDLNRNFDFNWSFGDSLLVPGFSCNAGYNDDFDYYRGLHPNSESEVQLIMDFVREKNFLLSIAYHSSRSGCIDRYVIYPWAWKDKDGEENRQYAPGFSVIEKLGMEIAEISGMDIGQNYGHTGSSFRKGNFHDWLYRETGCIQYLIEVGYTPDYDYGGDYLIESDYLDEVLESNINAFFHLLMRSAGQNEINALGESTDGNQIVGIISDAYSNEPISNAYVEILELDQGAILYPRKANKSGYFCRILHPNDGCTVIASAYGYESDTVNVEHSSSGPTEQNFSLTPSDRYDISFDVASFNNSIVNSRLLFKGSLKTDSIFFPQNQSINLPVDNYEVIISSEGYMPQVFEFDLHGDMHFSMIALYEKVVHKKNDINLIDDLDSLLFSLDGMEAGDSLMVFLDFKYELELDYDYFRGYYYNLDDSINFMELTGYNYENHESFIPFTLPQNHSNGFLGFILELDDKINYRGVGINEIKIIGSVNCNGLIGDMDDDGSWNVLDVVALANCILGANCNVVENGCAGDMNADGGWNVIDVVALTNCILNDDCP